MLIDNESKKIYQWFQQRLEVGNFDAVSGYFTVGAIAFLARLCGDKIKRFRFVFGDLVSCESRRDRTIDLLNENLAVTSAFELGAAARAAAAFLKADRVSVKTLEPNFCHAKVSLFKCASGQEPDCWFITGSSNLTEAGIGLKQTSNVELNTLGQGTASDYGELCAWFERLWTSPQAHSTRRHDGTKVDFKEYLIQEIERIYREYTPRDLYYTILFQLFGDRIVQEDLDPRFNRQVGRLENSVVYHSLYEFQQKGALSLIRMLQRHNGAVLADAVGLGKTWTALAVIKFFQLEGYETIVLCPKKLDHNWRRYLEKHNSRFEEDHFTYTVRYHTDLQDRRLEQKQDRLTINGYFRSDRPKLIVIDESHNLRNSKSLRYRTLVDTLLRQDAEVKVLMLSATPINNTLLDVRNQFKLVTRGEASGFLDTLGVRNIDHCFARAQKVFNEWRQGRDRSLKALINQLQPAFFRITDSLIVARTRKMIQERGAHFHFPRKERPDNEFVTPHNIGSFQNFDELLDHFPPCLSAYQPAFYVERKENVSLLDDQQLRDRFLVKMLYILMVKRLESSWYSFNTTVHKILQHHERALKTIQAYEQGGRNAALTNADGVELFDDEEGAGFEEMVFEGKEAVRLADVHAAGRLGAFKKDLQADIDKLAGIRNNLECFGAEIARETEMSGNHRSADSKLEVLIERIKRKRSAGRNGNNQKVLIFTAFTDTAFYLFDQLTSRGFERVAAVSGDESRTSDSAHSAADFEPILERFAPYTKLYLEKRWRGFTADPGVSSRAAFGAWAQWIGKNDPPTRELLHNPIDILIATDCLSEGQNLQDCDFVVNYDIHWNPVRAIQRMGRIDRLGSPNDRVYGLNFWPTESINRYLDLQGRVEDRMTAMKLAGSEVDSRFTERLREKAQDEDFERRMTERMLRQMEVTWDDIEISDQSFGFDDLSLETFRQDLARELSQYRDRYAALPAGIFSGFRDTPSRDDSPGLIALLGYPARPSRTREFTYDQFDLIYVDPGGKEIVLNQKEVLQFLGRNKDVLRYVPEGIDRGETEALSGLSAALKRWLQSQAVGEEVTDEGASKMMGRSAVDILRKLKTGDAGAVRQTRGNRKVEEKYDPDNCDLLAWVVVS